MTLSEALARVEAGEAGVVEAELIRQHIAQLELSKVRQTNGNGNWYNRLVIGAELSRREFCEKYGEQLWTPDEVAAINAIRSLFWVCKAVKRIVFAGSQNTSGFTETLTQMEAWAIFIIHCVASCKAATIQESDLFLDDCTVAAEKLCVAHDVLEGSRVGRAAGQPVGDIDRGVM